MTVNEVRQLYLDFFAKREHTVISSAPLVPDNDSTTLFTSSGMQPLIPYLLGEKHPKGTRLVNSQMCFRAEDIEEVGDNRHTTFFEMLGNWSLGDYFKKEQIPWVFEFLTNKDEGVGLDPKNIYVTVFGGDVQSAMDDDDEAVTLWKKLFLEKDVDAEFVELSTRENGGERGMQGGRIFAYGAQKNWWSRSGVPSNMPVGEPGGPDSEIFYDFGTPHDTKFGKECHPNCDCGRFVEIGNSVFMQYIKKEEGIFAELPKKNVDFGGGLERLAAATMNNPDIFSIDVFDKAREVLEKHFGKTYHSLIEAETAGVAGAEAKLFRIILDHMRSASFFIASGIRPSNTEQGYVLRRLIRRSLREVDKLGIKDTVLSEVASGFGEAYIKAYPFVQENAQHICEELKKEEAQFRKTLTHGLRELEKMGTKVDAFTLFTTYGFPVELTEEIAHEHGISIDRAIFDVRMKEHQEKSRAGAAQKFKGGLADTSDETTALHTATHLMLAGLRKYLGKNVHQAGSNITAERTRFDFTHDEKVSREVLDQVEEYVNEAIDKNCSVSIEQVSKEVARSEGVEASFWEKYPDSVKVYTVTAHDGTVYSRELCGGPHVETTGVMKVNGKHFKILKESASSAGVRRIKAAFV